MIVAVLDKPDPRRRALEPKKCARGLYVHYRDSVGVIDTVAFGTIRNEVYRFRRTFPSSSSPGQFFPRSPDRREAHSEGRQAGEADHDPGAGGDGRALLAATPPHETILRVLAYTGVRIGECFALQ